MRLVWLVAATMLLQVVVLAQAACDSSTYQSLAYMQHCAHSGDSCTTANTVCMDPPATCNNAGVCIDLGQPMYNQSCSWSMDCSNYGMQCYEGHCMLQSMATNDPCTIDAECLSHACIRNRCRGFDDGAVCETHGQCQIDSACINGRCAPRLSNGATCTDDVCPRGSQCYAGVCTPWFTLPDGTILAVDDSASAAMMCQSSLLDLDTSTTCVAASRPLEGHTCTDAQDGYHCICNTPAFTTGVLVGPQLLFAQAAKAFAACALNSKCFIPHSPFVFGPTGASCLYYECLAARQQITCAEMLSDYPGAAYMPAGVTCGMDFYRSVSSNHTQCFEWATECVSMPGYSPACSK